MLNTMLIVLIMAIKGYTRGAVISTYAILLIFGFICLFLFISISDSIDLCFSLSQERVAPRRLDGLEGLGC